MDFLNGGGQATMNRNDIKHIPAVKRNQILYYVYKFLEGFVLIIPFICCSSGTKDFHLPKYPF
jgi:hypothetical protein